MKKVVVVATGGTIASRRRGTSGAVAGVPGGDLLASVHVPRDTRVEVEQLFQLNSFNLTVPDMAVLAARVQELLSDSDTCGVVITHGTDTMEETGLFLALFLQPSKPIVLTGAQRTPGSIGSDGPRNLQDSLTLVADDSARGAGVMIVFDGAVWAIFGTRKTRTLDSAAFGSQNGPIGTINQGVVNIYRRVTHKRAFDLSAFRPANVRVDILPCYPGADTVALEALTHAGIDGLVVEGMGAGNPGRLVSKALCELLDRGLPMVLTSRVPNGFAAAIYGRGGGADLTSKGAILGGPYRAAQLRILMLAALGTARSSGDARNALNEYLA